MFHNNLDLLSHNNFEPIVVISLIIIFIINLMIILKKKGLTDKQINIQARFVTSRHLVSRDFINLKIVESYKKNYCNSVR